MLSTGNRYATTHGGSLPVSRKIVAARDGVALAELTDDDRTALAARDDGAFDVDPDDRPPPRFAGLAQLAVVDAGTGELLGQVNWHAAAHGPTAGCAAWNLGIGLLPGARGRGVSVPAIRLLAEHLFATTEVDRLEASTDRDNRAAQRLLAGAGFRREGTIRGAQVRGGERRDMIGYSLLRTDVPPAAGERRIVALRDGVALATLVSGDQRWLAEQSDHAYDVDADDRPARHLAVEVQRLAVVDAESGDLLGQVNWHARGHGPTAGCTAWGVGIGLVPAARGRGAGSTALRLLAEHLFATTEVDRVEASADAENRPSRRALVKAGFRQEGTTRGAQVRGGERRDMVAFGLLRDDLAVSDPDGRVMVVDGDGFALAEWTPRDEDQLLEQDDRTFDVDLDDRPPLHLRSASRRCAVVDPAGALLGQVTWHTVGYGPTAGCTAWNVGLMLLPSARGKGVGAAATRLLAEHLFATTAVDRVEAGTDRDNLAAQRVLAKAGFHREGTIRGARLRGGARRDMIGFSLLRSDVPEPDADEREVVATADGLALGRPRAGDKEWLAERDDHAFEADPDPRPTRNQPQVSRLVVLDRHTDELLGAVGWHAVGYGPSAACEAWNIGIGLLPTARGRGAGATALRMLAEYLFASTDLDRIEAGTDRDNVPCQRALAKAGFRAEGLLRGVHVRGGRRRDMLSYSLLRADLDEPPEPGQERTHVVARDGVVLAEPASGDREKFYVDGAGEFAIDKDDRPRVTGPGRSFLLSVIDEATGDLLGGVSWHAVDYGGTVSCSAWNIGIGLLPAARGRGVGTLAQRLLAEHLFATTELDRVEASTDVANVAERRALEKAGFRREGVLRGAQLRGGVRRDLVHFGLVRGDF